MSKKLPVKNLVWRDGPAAENDAYKLGRIVALENAIRWHYHRLVGNVGVKDNISERTAMAEKYPQLYVTDAVRTVDAYKAKIMSTTKGEKTHMIDEFDKAVASLSDVFALSKNPLRTSEICLLVLGREHQLRYNEEYRELNKDSFKKEAESTETQDNNE